MSYNFNYRISKVNNIVCDSIPRNCYGQCIQILARPSKRKPDEYIALRHTRQEDLDKAVKALNIMILRPNFEY